MSMVPAKPTLLYDGECLFCCRWIKRWKMITSDKVEYYPYQEALEKFPKVPEEKCQNSVVLIEPDRKVSFAAEAVFKVLAVKPSRKVFLWLYNHCPGFAPMSEFLYKFVATHRVFFSKITSLLWGKDLSLPTYQSASLIFLRFLGLIYTVAFVSLAVQFLNLFGSEGILPAENFLKLVEQNIGSARFWNVPTLAWINSSDAFLSLLCWIGVGLGVLLMVGVLPWLCLILLWVLYLSVFSIGQAFLSFQWDILLLEVGFLSIFLAPFCFFLSVKKFSKKPTIVSWLFRFLLFRLMFSSGIVKLLSGDRVWEGLKALNYHYETQPLPTWIGWYAHQLPEWIQKFSVVMMFGIELILPFFLFLPRRSRHFACWTIIFFQILIMLTGNYCFFNLLTIALCLLSLDDTSWIWNFKRKEASISEVSNSVWMWPRPVRGVVAGLLIFLGVMSLSSTLRWSFEWPTPAKVIFKTLRPLKLVNSYGLFAVMTTRRLEIEIEGSYDGSNWKVYQFKYKPGDVKVRPKFVQPHQPRVDWQMWFAALSSFRSNAWFINLSQGLLRGNKAALSFFKEDPFEGTPPRYIRAAAYDYKFTSFSERKETGSWWKRERKGLYLPTISLKRGLGV